MLNWLATLPPVAVYGVLALLAAVENVIPPVPADTAVALGAFLTHRGVTTLPLVYLVTLVSNVGGAVAVYLMARRYGRRLFATRTGQRLLSPEALALIEREYLRFGVLGIFFGRFLPGVRAVVPPFAGLANLGAARAIIPIATASAIWYGGVALLGSAIGAEWNHISAFLGQLNRTLALVAVGVVCVVAIVIWRGRKREGRLWRALRRAMPGRDATDGAAAGAMGEAALVLVEVAYADVCLTPEERRSIADHLRDRWQLPQMDEVPVPDDAELRSVRHRLTAQFGRERRQALLERLWTVALGEPGTRDLHGRVLQSAARLLGLSSSEIAQVEQRVHAAQEPPA